MERARLQPSGAVPATRLRHGGTRRLAGHGLRARATAGRRSVHCARGRLAGLRNTGRRGRHQRAPMVPSPFRDRGQPTRAPAPGRCARSHRKRRTDRCLDPRHHGIRRVSLPLARTTLRHLPDRGRLPIARPSGSRGGASSDDAARFRPRISRRRPARPDPSPRSCRAGRRTSARAQGRRRPHRSGA